MTEIPTALTSSASAVMGTPPVMESVDAAMKAFVNAQEISGSVTVVADADKILHLSATGLADLEMNRPMEVSTIFWIASMSKPITATAVMMMQDEGKLSVDDRVSKYLPEFTGDKAGITLKQCLNHSSGLDELDTDETKDVTNLAELIPLIAAKPLVFSPSSKWSYCQTSINTVARVVEIVYGKSFPEFLDERLFKPLGMKDTTFYPSAEQITRIANCYKRTDNGKLEKAAITLLGTKSFTDKNRYPLASGGLFSTADDYTRFAQMILRGGELDGKRYLKPETVKQMTTVQTGDLVAGFLPGSAWGLAWSIVNEPQGITSALSPGSFGHGGLFGTQVWIDPVKGRIYLLLIQRANFENQGGSDGSEIRSTFQNAAANLPAFPITSSLW